MATARKRRDAAKVALFNPGATPVVYSEQGHILPSAEHCEVDSLDAVGREAVAHGLLVDESVQAKDEDDGAAAADDHG